MAAADMTDEEWVGRWGLQRGGTVGVDDHLTMVLYDDNTLRPPLPEQVLEYNEPTPGYCCPLTANTYGIEFERFHIRDMSDPDNPGGGAILFEVAKDPNMPKLDNSTIPPSMEDQVRCICYDFGDAFLELSTIGTTLTFSVGDNEMPNFRMIERFYFRDQLIRSFDFQFGFGIPNSTNTWEAIYEMPELSEELKQQMIENPWESQSDSFYYVGDEMVLHNKAKYAYTRPA